jgi:tetratricopeptide (TPR) repeat protein
MLLNRTSFDVKSRTSRLGIFALSVPAERLRKTDFLVTRDPHPSPGVQQNLRRVLPWLEPEETASLDAEISVDAAGFELVRVPIRWAGEPALEAGVVLAPAGSPPLSPDPQRLNVLLQGTVRDREGRPVPHAQVALLGAQESRSRAVSTDESGHYQMVLLQVPLSCEFEISKAGLEIERFALSLKSFKRQAHPQLLAGGNYDFVLPLASAASVLAEAGARSVRQEEWSSHYRRGVDALERQDWPAAVEELLAAIGGRPRSGGEVALADGRAGPYLPYLQLGIAYLNLGRFEEAMDAFETEERYKVVTEHRRDLENLRTFRRFAEEARQAATAQNEQRLAEAVRASVDESATLERQGRFEEALAALDPAIATAPEDQTVSQARDRLQGILDDQAETRALESRLARLTAEGRAHLEAGRYEEAAARFRQALDLGPSREIDTLLGEVQAKLRQSLAPEQDTATRISQNLSAAKSLAQEDLIDPALARLETVLSMDPDLPEALELQGQLLVRRKQQDQAEYEETAIAALMEQGIALFEAGEIRQALANFNRVIAIDDENSAAQTYLQRAYDALSQSVLRGASLTRLAPVLVVTNRSIQTGPVAKDSDAVLEERVSSSHFVLNALILDDQPTITVSCCSGDAAAGTDSTQQLGGERVGSLYRFNYSVPLRLESGWQQFQIVVRDSDGLAAEASHRVRYQRPLLRSPWFYSGIGALVPLGLVAGLGLRARRRNRLLKRRFNPYVAGAPVLDSDLFVGRESLISRILDTIHHNSVLIYGERRIGKTSLLHHLKRRLQALEDPRYEFFPVFIDLEGTNQEDFFATIAADVFEELRPHLGEIEGPAAAEGNRYGYHELARDLARVVRTLAASTARQVKVVLLIDEVDQLNSYDPRVNQSLRKLFMKNFAESLVAVMSGVSIRRHWGMEGSPWYNFFEEIEIGSLEDRHAELLVRAPIKGVFRLDPPVVERILELSGRKPYAIQKMCAALVNRSHELGSRRITVEDVESLATAAGS